MSRSPNAHPDARVYVQQVDYSSVESLTNALVGQDAVVNTLGIGTVSRETHLRLVEAAHATGVKRFIPSEFGGDTAHPLTAKLPVYADKVDVLQRLYELSQKSSQFSYTAVANGAFLDWGIKHNFLVNFAGPTTPIYDHGDVKFSATTLSTVGKAVAGVLQHLEETKNRYVYVSEAEVTQNQLVLLSNRGDQIQRVQVNTEDLEAQAYDAIKQTPPDFYTFAVNLLWRATYGGKFGALFQKTDNDLVGIKKLSELELSRVVAHSL